MKKVTLKIEDMDGKTVKESCIEIGGGDCLMVSPNGRDMYEYDDGTTEAEELAKMLGAALRDGGVVVVPHDIKVRVIRKEAIRGQNLPCYFKGDQ